MLEGITFPVFKLRSHDHIEERSKILYVTTCYGKFILDNKNLKGDTLGERRLRISGEKYPLNKKFDSFHHFILQKDSKGHYIDKKGVLFRYKRFKFVTITYKKVLDVVPVEDVGLNLKVSGVAVPIIVPGNYKPKAYVGLIHWLNGYLYYEFSEEERKDRRIKI